MGQQIENLRLDGNQIGATAQLPPFGIKYLICKEKSQRARSGSNVKRGLSKPNIKLISRTNQD